jgi:hypothetical protein
MKHILVGIKTGFTIKSKRSRHWPSSSELSAYRLVTVFLLNKNLARENDKNWGKRKIRIRYLGGKDKTCLWKL